MTKFLVTIKKEDASQMTNARQIINRVEAVKRKNENVLNDREILAILDEEPTNTDEELLAFVNRRANQLQKLQDVLPITLPISNDDLNENNLDPLNQNNPEIQFLDESDLDEF